MQKSTIITALDEVFNEESLEINQRKERSNLGTSYFNNLLFVCDDTDDANKDIKDYLDNKGLNIITVSPNGYEIPKETAQVRLSDHFCVATVLYPSARATDELKKEHTVLFLPNLDQMNDLIYRRLLLDVMRTHIVADPRNGEDGFTKLHYSFIVIATVGKISMNEFACLTQQDAKGCFRITKTYE